MQLKNKDVDMALAWAQEKHKELEDIGSDLYFNLH